MKRNKAAKKAGKRMSNAKLMFLSIVLLFIIFEALYIVKGDRKSIQSNSLERSVAGVTIEK